MGRSLKSPWMMLRCKNHLLLPHLLFHQLLLSTGAGGDAVRGITEKGGWACAATAQKGPQTTTTSSTTFSFK